MPSPMHFDGFGHETPSATGAQISYIEKLCHWENIDVDDAVEEVGVSDIQDLDIEQASEVIDWLKEQ